MSDSSQSLETLQRALDDSTPARPGYFKDTNIDRLFGVMTSLAGEVAVTCERLDTLERLLDEKGLISTKERLQYEPNDDVVAERMSWHQAFVARLFRVLNQEIEEVRAGR